jgi:bifunctional DNA-binding transcriptional regulator/antitoxin component of YhaV-PrlF toxin-antitoxin module
MKSFTTSLLYIVAALTLASCALMQDTPMAEEFDSYASRATGFVYHLSPFWYSITIVNFARGEQPFPEDRLVPVAGFRGEGTSFQWSIEADSTMVDDVKEELAEFETYLHHYSRILNETGWLEDFEPHFRIGFAPPNARLDHSHHTRFLRRPEFLFLRSPGSDSPNDLHAALLDLLRTIHHEMVHMAARTGAITIPGHSREVRGINEEAFATINEYCGQLVLKEQSEHGFGFRKNINITFKDENETIEPREMLKALFEEVAEIDHPVIRRGTLGMLIGTFVAYEPDPIGTRFGGDRSEQRLQRCAEISHAPQDFYSQYLDNGLPDTWAQMLFPESG